jgi:hypothetical protein
MDYLEHDGKKYEVSGYAGDGLPIIKASATTTEDGFDDEGNPVRSVKINVPAVTIGVTPGEVQ